MVRTWIPKNNMFVTRHGTDQCYVITDCSKEGDGSYWGIEPCGEMIPTKELIENYYPDSDFLKNCRDSAKDIFNRPAWMMAGITLNENIFETYSPEEK